MYGIFKDGQVIAKFVAPMSVSSNQPTFSADALSLKRNSFKRTAQRWELSCQLEPLSFNANELFALFVEKGDSEPIQIIMPQNYGAIQAMTSSGTGVTATGAKDSTSVTLSGNSGHIPAGNFVQFTNHSKVYMVKQGLTNDGVLHIYPGLHVAVAGTAVKMKADIVAPFYLQPEVVKGMSFIDGILMDLGAVNMVEKL